MTRILLCAGLDPGGRAGLAADLHACWLAGATGLPVVAARTAQTDAGVAAAWPTEPAELRATLGTALAGSVAAVKTGMLGSIANLRTVLEVLPGVPLVVDPLLRASSGGWLWPGESELAVRRALLDELLPRATVATPNWSELAWLADRLPADDLAGAEVHLRRLPGPVVLKGGHAPEPWRGVDWLWDGKSLTRLPDHPRWQGEVRGTGCRFATLLAVELARTMAQRFPDPSKTGPEARPTPPALHAAATTAGRTLASWARSLDR